jgi:hypothetical protein
MRREDIFAEDPEELWAAVLPPQGPPVRAAVDDAAGPVGQLAGRL